MAALAILIIGWWLSARAARALHQTLQHTHVDDTLRPMLASIVQWVIRVLTVVLVLSQFGVQTASIIAMLGAAGLAIGLALQGTLPGREVMVVRYTDRGVTLNARYWTSNDNFWSVQFGLYAKLKSTVERAGCRIAVPVQEVHVPEVDDTGTAEAVHADGHGEAYTRRPPGSGRPN